MQIDVNNGAFQVVMESVDLNVVFGDSAKIDVGYAINYIKSGQAEIEEAVDAGIAEFDASATAKTNAFNQNASNKTTAFNDNATAKTGEYNQNATDKTNAFNSNASDKTTAFNNNATAKTGDFDTNATNKTNAFNQNATEKQAAVDASAVLAASFANQSKQYAIGDPTEPLGNSAKYWAGQASSSVSGLGARVDAIEGKIPSTATANNQLTDKSYVDNADSSLQQQIDAITAASDVTDIVGTYSELQAYDTSSLPNNSIIKVLQDESRDDETTYYRWVITGGVGAWVLIGEEGPYYTIASADATFQEKLVSGTNIKTVNGNSLVGSGNVDIDALPTQTGQAGKFLTTDGTNASWAEASVTPDNKSISKNASNALQTIGVINQNDTTTALKVWSGDEADLPAVKDANTFYATEEELSVSLLDTLYPVGSIYITTNAACPLSTLIAGSTWVLVGQDRVLQGAGTRGVVGATLNESLPNITGRLGLEGSGDQQEVGGCVYIDNNDTNITMAHNVAVTGYANRKIDASLSSSTYQDDAPVQPDAYLVNIFRRIS